MSDVCKRYIVQLANNELEVESIEALCELARQGQLELDTPIKVEGQDAWSVARSVPELLPLLQKDPWSAWDGMDEETADQALEGFSLGDAPSPDLPETKSESQMEAHDDPEEEGAGDGFPMSVTPAQAPRPPHQVVEELPDNAVVPVDEDITERHAPAAFGGLNAPGDGPRSPERPQAMKAAENGNEDLLGLTQRGGKVIAFPGAEPVSATKGSYALDIERMLADRPSPKSIEKRKNAVPRIRWWRVILFASAMIVGMVLVRWHVTQESTEVFVPRSQWVGNVPPVQWKPAAVKREAAPAAAAAVVEEPEEIAEAVEPEPPIVLDRMEDELRAQMRPGIVDVKARGDLEDSLLIELRWMHVDVRSVDAKVTKWVGRKQDAPGTAELRVRFKSRAGELDRELAGIGLVVGKYVQHYSLEVPRFEVLVEGLGSTPRMQAVDAKAARLFYLQRQSLVEFLTPTE